MLWYGVSHGHGCLWHDGWHGLRHDGCPMLRIFRIVMEGPKDTMDTLQYAYNISSYISYLISRILSL